MDPRQSSRLLPHPSAASREIGGCHLPPLGEGIRRRDEGIAPYVEAPSARISHGAKKLPRFPGGASPRMPCRLSSNLHTKAGGSPKFCFTASNVRHKPGGSLLPTSGISREACNPQIQIGIPYKRCGFHEPQVHRDKHAHRRALFLFSQRIRGGRGDYSLPSSSSSSSKSRTMKCSYTSLSWSSSSMDSNSSSPFSSSTERRMMMP